MNQKVKKLLNTIHVYYPLQGFYRNVLFSLKKIKLRKQYAKYKGDGYNCNYCGAAYTKFAPWYPDPVNSGALGKNNVIAGYGENIICPSCLSTARERLLKAVFVDCINIEKIRILHISPEKQFYDFIKQQALVTAVDYSPGFYKKVDPLIQFADATRLSFSDHSFDMVIGNHIMEHIPDDRAAMDEIYRVLQPGGRAILQVPFSESLTMTIEEPGISSPVRQSALFGQHDHVRIYALRDYLERLTKAGFIVAYMPYQSLERFYRYAIQKNEGFISIRK